MCTPRLALAVGLVRDRLDRAGVTGPAGVPPYRDVTAHAAGHGDHHRRLLQTLLGFLHHQANDPSVDESGRVVLRELAHLIRHESHDSYDGA
jgi:hypothetical protein